MALIEWPWSWGPSFILISVLLRAQHDSYDDDNDDDKGATV